MVKVYFEIQEDDEVIYDLEGVEFDDLAKAKSKAETSNRIQWRSLASFSPRVPRI